MTELCYCGKPLHYNSKLIQEYIEYIINKSGEHVKVISPENKTYLVSLHYIALHGIKADLLHTYGFEEIITETNNSIGDNSNES